MKIKNRKTNEVFDSPVNALYDFCLHQPDGCHWCPLGQLKYYNDCVELFVTDFEKTVTLMNCVIVRDKPPICDFFNVEVGQRFRLDDEPSNRYYVNNNGQIINCGITFVDGEYNEEKVATAAEVCHLINNVDSLSRYEKVETIKTPLGDESV